jgi:hypothetical protein
LMVTNVATRGNTYTGGSKFRDLFTERDLAHVVILEGGRQLGHPGIVHNIDRGTLRAGAEDGDRRGGENDVLAPLTASVMAYKPSKPMTATWSMGTTTSSPSVRTRSCGPP